MKILAIGGSGVLGASFVNRAMERGHRVTVLSRGVKPVPSGADHLKLDRNYDAAWNEAVMGGRDLSDGGDMDRPGTGEYDFSVDFMGRGQKQGVQMLGIDGWGKPNLFVSSDLVYSPRQSAYPLGEGTSRYESRGPGGEKYQTEWLFNSGSSKRFTNVLRPAFLYGPGLPLDGPLPPFGGTLIERIRRDGRLELPFGGQYLFQPLFLDDFVNVILAFLERPGIRASKFNVPGPELVEMARFYTALAEILGVKLEIVPVLGETDSPWCRHRILDGRALREAGLPAPSTGLWEGLERCLELAKFKESCNRFSRPGHDR